MTPQERNVLRHFLWNEGYSAYPAKIERDLRNRVTRTWAGKICRDFSELGILGYRLKKPRRQKNNTEHYFLKKSLDAFLKIAEMCLLSGNHEDARMFFNSPYAQKRIDSALIKDVLHRKEVEIRRAMGLDEWREGEARELYKEFIERNKDEMPESILVGFDEYMRRRKDPKGPFSFPPMICLRLPVLPDDTSEETRRRIVEGMNKEAFAEYEGLGFNWSGVEGHYEVWQEEKLVLPFLVLIQISPSALGEFLFGEYKAYDPQPEGYYSFSTDGTEMIRHVMFGLIFRAIVDLSNERNIPTDSIVSDVQVRPHYSVHGGDGREWLLAVFMKDERIIYIDAGFSTTDMWYGDKEEDVYEVVTDPEDCWVNTWVKGQ